MTPNKYAEKLTKRKIAELAEKRRSNRRTNQEIKEEVHKLSQELKWAHAEIGHLQAEIRLIKAIHDLISTERSELKDRCATLTGALEVVRESGLLHGSTVLHERVSDTVHFALNHS